MKPACRLARLSSSLRDDAHPRHAATCPQCQAYFAARSGLETGLRRTAPAARGAAPDDLERSIMAAVHRSRAPEPAPRRALPWGAIGTYGAAAAVIALGAVYFQRSGQPASREIAAADAQAIMQSVTAFSTDFSERVLPTAGALVTDNPLQAEATAVYDSARSALDFLALNFLPGATEPAKRG
ncbi:MAG TPA: hypothetical protein VGE76_04830 [Opitutaceae bacterium]